MNLDSILFDEFSLVFHIYFVLFHLSWFHPSISYGKVLYENLGGIFVFFFG